jgi:hypothetical protein
MKMIQTFQEKIEMIAQLTAGNQVKFQYVERKLDKTHLPAHTQYQIKDYEGTILQVRDLFEDELSYETIMRNRDIERSQYLLTVQMPDNKIKSFYDGRVVNVKKINKSFITRLVDKLTGK